MAHQTVDIRQIDLAHVPLMPHVEYTDTKANITALAGLLEGATAYATDTDQFGTYNGSTWTWFGVVTVITINTEANILASSAATPAIAYGSDTQFFYVADGSVWRRSSLKLYSDSANPDIGYAQNNSKDGYYATFITNKYLYNVVLQGYNVSAVNGAIRINTTVTPNTFEIYMRSTGWYTVIYDLSIALGYFVHYPFSSSQPIKVWSGMSVAIGANGRPLVNEYTVSIGADPPMKLICGGTF